MLVIVGHGPGVLRASGEWIDTQTVVRLKHAPMSPSNFGTRTDYLCATSQDWRARFKKRFDISPTLWLFDHNRHYQRSDRLGKEISHGVFLADTPRWIKYFAEFKPKNPKPSTGLCAVFCAVEQGFNDIALVGFDSFTTDDRRTGKWFDPTPSTLWYHDQRAERQALEGLGVSFHHI